VEDSHVLLRLGIQSEINVDEEIELETGWFGSRVYVCGSGSGSGSGSVRTKNARRVDGELAAGWAMLIRMVMMMLAVMGKSQNGCGLTCSGHASCCNLASGQRQGGALNHETSTIQYSSSTC